MSEQQCWAHTPDPADGMAAWLRCSDTGQRYENKFADKHLYACSEHVPFAHTWSPNIPPRADWKQLLMGQEP